MDFETYFIVFLESGPEATGLDEEGLAQLQDAHIAHLQELRRRGATLTEGPFAAEPGDPLRGFVIFPGEMSLETVERLAGEDPSVRAGRLRVTVRKWYTPKGRITWNMDRD
ncbi:hypothetical protein JW905_17595 [bacterium]|nr:hypothetical protein [candidate division CSSED10-310 bacterium]